MRKFTIASLLFILPIVWIGLACGAAPQQKKRNQREAILQEINALEQLYRQQLDDRRKALELNDVAKALLENPDASRRDLVRQLGGVTAESSLRIKALISGSQSRIRRYKRNKAEYPKRIAEFRATLDRGSDRDLLGLGIHVNVALRTAKTTTQKARRDFEEAKQLKDNAPEIREALVSLLNRIEQLDKQALNYFKQGWEGETDQWRIKQFRGQHNLEESLHLKRMPKLQAELEHCVDSQLPWLEKRLNMQLHLAEGRVNMARENVESAKQ